MITTLTVLFGFTFIIFIHELGHFLAARRVGIQVDVFSIGIGPRIITLFRDASGTEYILSLLPLGGYVKMLGQEDVPSSKPSEVKSHLSFSAKKPSQRLFVVVAGVFMNLVSAYLMIVVAYTIGIDFTTNKVGQVNPNSPIATTEIQAGEDIVSLNGKEINSFEDILTTTAFIGDQSAIEVGLERPDGTRYEVTTIAYKQENIPFAQLGVRPYPVATLASLPPTSPYYEVGLRSGMRIEKVVLEDNGKSLSRQTTPGIVNLIRNYPERSIAFHIKQNAGQDTEAPSAVYSLVIPQTTIKERGFEISSQIEVAPNFPAALAGIQNGDIITMINGEPIRSYEALQSIMNKLDSNDPISITVDRDAQEQTFSLIPRYDESSERFIIGVNSRTLPGTEVFPPSKLISYTHPAMEEQVPGLRVGDQLARVSHSNFSWYTKLTSDTLPLEEHSAWTALIVRNGVKINLNYSDNLFPKIIQGMPPPLRSGDKTIQYSILGSIVKSVNLFTRELQEVYLFLLRLIQGTVPTAAVGGPIAIFDTFQTLSDVKGPSYFLLLFAKISISLAIINMLPIPLLDGGHAMFISYEMIRRKPPPENLVRVLNLLGFLFLIFLMIFVNVNDIMRLINR